MRSGRPQAKGLLLLLLLLKRPRAKGRGPEDGQQDRFDKVELGEVIPDAHQ